MCGIASIFEFGERLLRDTDEPSMAASVEMHLPLVNRVLLENVHRLPDHERYYSPEKKLVLRWNGLP